MRWIGVNLVAISLLLAACAQHSGDKEKKRRVLAEVNGVPIYVDQFQRELQRVRLDDEEGQPSAASMQAQKRALVDDLIDRRILLQEADRHNVLVGIDEVEAAYQKSRAGWEPDDLDAALEAKDITAAELKAEIRDGLMVSKYFRENVFARVAVTDAEITEYVESHPEIQVIPEQVRALQIVVKTAEKAKEVIKEIRGGLPFEDAAEKYSLGPTADNGGDLGFFSRGSMPRLVDEVCFRLRPGEMSEVVASDFGYHIFKVIEKRPEELKPVEQARDAAENLLRRRKERAAEEAKLAELRNAATIVIHEKELARVD